MKCYRQFLSIIVFPMAVILIVPSVTRADINDELIEAATFGDIDGVKDLIERGADVNAKSLYAKGGVVNTTALMRAAYEGHIEIVRLLIDRGADVNVKDSDGQSALMWAAFRVHTSIAKLLIEKGADVKKGEGWAVLLQVVSGIGVSVSASPGRDKEAPEAQKIEFVKLLINNGVDVNWSSRSGDTPLSEALLSGETAITRILLENGADPNIQMINGQTPLMFAIAANDTEMINLLMDRQADVNFKSQDDSTALMTAAGRGRIDIAEVLIKKGADINVSNKNGDTALSLAKMNGHTETIELLKQAGAVGPEEEAQLPLAIEQKASRPILYLDIEDKEGMLSAVTKGVYPDGQSLGRLVRGAGAVWSPDGKWFAIVTEENSLILRNLRGETRNIFAPEKEHISQPIWSPDSKRIAVVAIAAENVVYVVVIDIAQKKVLSRHRVPMWAAPLSKFRWSPGASRILLVSGNPLFGGTVVIDLDVGRTESITDKFSIAEWAPGGDSVYYFEINVNQFYEQELTGFYLKKLGASKPVELMDKGKVESLGLKRQLQINLSTDGARLFLAGGIFTQGDPKGEFKSFIYIYDVSGGKNAILDKPFKQYQTKDFIISSEWSPDENSLAVLTIEMPAVSIKIKILDLLNGTWKTIAELDTSKVQGTDFLDMLYFLKPLSWTR